jgi:hypothetical protein
LQTFQCTTFAPIIDKRPVDEIFQEGMAVCAMHKGKKHVSVVNGANARRRQNGSVFDKLQLVWFFYHSSQQKTRADQETTFKALNTLSIEIVREIVGVFGGQCPVRHEYNTEREYTIAVLAAFNEIDISCKLITPKHPRSMVTYLQTCDA